MRKTKTIRMVAWSLSTVFAVGMMQPSFALLPVQAAESDSIAVRNLNVNQNGTCAGVHNPQRLEEMGAWKGNYITFGSYAQGEDGTKQPVRWRILQTDADSDADGSADSYLLLSDQILDQVPFQQEVESGNTWKDSTLQAWLNDTFAKSFSKEELGAIAKTQKAEGQAVDYLTAPAVQNEQFFLLSAEETQKAEYGFYDAKATAKENESNRLSVTAYAQKQGVAQTDGYGDFWLRSSSTEGKYVAGILDHEGWLYDDLVSDDATGVAPALHLQKDSIAYLMADGVKKGDFGIVSADKSNSDTWAVTLKGSSENLNAIQVKEADPQGAVIVAHKSATSVLQSATQVSAIIMDQLGNVICYGKINEDITSKKSRVLIPDSVAAGEYQLYVFAEQIAEGSDVVSDLGSALPISVVDSQEGSSQESQPQASDDISVSENVSGNEQQPSQEVSERPQPSVSERIEGSEPTSEFVSMPEQQESNPFIASDSSDESSQIPSVQSEPRQTSGQQEATASINDGSTQPVSESNIDQPTSSSTSQVPAQPVSQPSESASEPMYVSVPAQESVQPSTSDEPYAQVISQPTDGEQDVQRASYYVCLRDMNGEEVYTQAYPAQTKLKLSAPQAHAGYQFKEWKGTDVEFEDAFSHETTFVVPEYDVMIVPTYEESIYQLRYELNGGTLPTQNPSSYTITSATISLANPMKSGYTFTGWTWSGQEVPQMNVAIATGTIGDITFVANWTKSASSSVSASTSLGSIDPSATSNTISTTSKPSNLGDASTSSSSSKPMQNTEYKISYEKNTSASVSGLTKKTDTYPVGSTAKIATALISKSAFFNGWNTKADGSGKSYKAGQAVTFTTDTVLYAQWKSTHTTGNVTYCVNGKKTVSCIGMKTSKSAVKIADTITVNKVTYQVTKVAQKAFYQNKKLTSVTVGNNVKQIASQAFYQCTSLKKVVIGTGLTKIDSKAFGKNKKGCTIQIKSTKLKTVKGVQNTGTQKLKLKVPTKKKTAYKKLFQATLKKRSASIS